MLEPRRWWIVGGSRRTGGGGRAGLSLAKGVCIGLDLFPMGGFSGLLLDHPGGGEVRLSLKVSCRVKLGLSYLLSKGLLLCCCCIRLLLSGDAGGYSITFLLEDVFADLGLGKPDGLGRTGGSLGLGGGLEFGKLASFCQLPGLLGIEGPLGRGEVCSVSGRSQPLLLSLLRGGSLCGDFVRSLPAVVGLLGEAFFPVGTLLT